MDSPVPPWPEEDAVAAGVDEDNPSQALEVCWQSGCFFFVVILWNNSTPLTRRCVLVLLLQLIHLKVPEMVFL